MQQETVPGKPRFKFATVESIGWIMKERGIKRRGVEVMEGAEWMCGYVWQSTRLKRREIGRERRGALVKVSVVICSGVLATFPLPDWMFYERCRIRKGGRLIIQLTEVFLWWMGRGAARREEGCNKAECISPGMKLQRLGGGRREREGWWSDTNISVFAVCTICPDVCVLCCWRQCVERSLSLFSMRGTSPP